MMMDPSKALRTLTDLSEYGITFSIDDFGTGYSSLSYLKRLPVSEIKIDRSFIMDMSIDADDRVIVNTTLQMSHNLGLMVVAEGIEDHETLTSLKEMGCDLAQGYFICRPIARNKLLDWFDESNYSILTSPMVTSPTKLSNLG